MNQTLGLHYSSTNSSVPSLNVGLICDNTTTDKDSVIEGPLEFNLLTNSFSTWNKSPRNCSVY